MIIEEFQGIIPLNMILPANKRKEGGYGHGDKKSLNWHNLKILIEKKQAGETNTLPVIF